MSICKFLLITFILFFYFLSLVFLFKFYIVSFYPLFVYLFILQIKSNEILTSIYNSILLFKVYL